MALVDNSQSNYYKGAEKIAELVNEATEGKIQLTIQAGGVLGGEADTLDMAIQGDLDIATCANSVLANYIPEMSILDQAFLWDSADQANYAVQNELGDLISAEAEKHGLHVIGYLESGFRDVFSKKPIQTPADFKGVKIRVMQNEDSWRHLLPLGLIRWPSLPPSSSQRFSREPLMHVRMQYLTAGLISIMRQE